MRGVAALLVVLTHALNMVTHGTDLSYAGFLGQTPRLDNFGSIGLDLFFVISGFVMAFSVAGRKGGKAARDFIVLRWIRIAPPYIIASLPVLLFTYGAYQGARSIVNWLVFVPLLDHGSYTFPPIGLGWTLSFEFTFYLMVALAVWAGLSNRMMVLAGWLVVLSLIGAVTSPPVFMLGWITNPILLEFAFGLLSFELWRRGYHRRYRRAMIWLGALGLTVLVCQLLFWGYGQVSDAKLTLAGSVSLERALIWGVPMTVIFLAGLAMGTRGTSTSSRLGLELGKRSYSLYLVHIPVFIAVENFRAAAPFVLPAPVFLIVLFALALASCWVFFDVCERPLTIALRDRYRARVAHAA